MVIAEIAAPLAGQQRLFSIYRSSISTATLTPTHGTLILLLCVLSISFIIQAPCSVHAESPPTRILSVHYPSSVQAGSTFSVVIQVGYSSKFGMVDVGVWDLANGTVVRSLVSNATLAGAGNSTYTLTIQAPATSHEWRLSAIARAWVQDAWFYDSEGQFDFAITVTDHAYLTLMNLRLNSSVMVDGWCMAVNQSTMVIPMGLGEVHNVHLEDLLQIDPATRLVFVGWNDGIDSNPREILLTENMTLSPIYRTQYFLSVSSELGSTAGGGWYWEGSIAEFGVPANIQQSPSFFGLLTNSFRFMGWSVDSNSTSPTSTIVMNRPKDVTAQWAGETNIPSPSGIATVFTAASIFLAIRIGLIRKQRRAHLGGSRLSFQC